VQLQQNANLASSLISSRLHGLESHGNLKVSEMLCQLISIFEAGKSSFFIVLEPFDDARSNVIFFGIGPSGFPL
jgi:hypothetical protein